MTGEVRDLMGGVDLIGAELFVALAGNFGVDGGGGVVEQLFQAGQPDQGVATLGDEGQDFRRVKAVVDGEVGVVELIGGGIHRVGGHDYPRER